MPSSKNLMIFTAILFLQFHQILAFSDDDGFLETLEEFPNLAAFRGNLNGSAIYVRKCTASIISRRHLLTSAQCLRNLFTRPSFDAVVVNPGEFYNVSDMESDVMPSLQIYVLLGQPDIRSPETILVNVSRVAVPPQYPYPIGHLLNNNPLSFLNDLLLLEIAEPLNFSSTINLIKLLSEKGYQKISKEEEKTFVMAAWGFTGNYTYIASKGNWSLACNEVCGFGAMEYYHYWRNYLNYSTSLTNEQLGQIGANMSLALEQGLVCGIPNPSNTEQGNLGGPAMVKSKTGQLYQVGILYDSFFKTRPFYNLRVVPFIMTHVSANCEWIKEITNDEVECHDFE